MTRATEEREAKDVPRVVGPEATEDEQEFDAALRPRLLAEFVGQHKVKEQFGLLIEGARQRGEPVDHVLLSGPPQDQPSRGQETLPPSSRTWRKATSCSWTRCTGCPGR